MPVTPRSSPLPAIAAFLLLMGAAPCLAVHGINTDGSLNKQAISKAYFEGEFWTVINALEAFRKSGKPCDREDSIYTFKYLSVVYAAEPETRVKAESYMYQLIRMMPTIDLLDLYISDNIQSIFLKVKSEYEELESRKVLASAKPAAARAPDPGPSAAPDRPASGQSPAPGKSSSRLKLWVPLAIGGVGAATAAYFLVTSDGDGKDSPSPRPVDITMEWPKEGAR